MWGPPFARELSLKKSADSFLRFRLALLHCVLLLFPLSTTFVFIHGFLFYFIWQRWGSLDQPICWCVCLWRLYRKSWLTYTDGTGRPGELCYDFSISNDLTQMLNFPTRIHDRGSRNPALLDLFPLTLLFVLQWLSLHWKILIMLTQFPLDFQKLKTGCHVSSHSLWLFSCWLGWSSWSFERCSMGGYH